MWPNRLYEVLSVGQRYAAATGMHQGRGNGKGHGRGGHHHHPRMKVFLEDLQRAGQKREYRVEYSPSDEARRAFWQKLKASYPELKQRSDLTRMVNEYLKGSYRRPNGLYYDANQEEHRNAMVLFYNMYLKSKRDPPLNEWFERYERGMSDLYDTKLFEV